MEEEYDPTQHTLTIEQLEQLNRDVTPLIQAGWAEDDLVIYVRCSFNGQVLQCEMRPRQEWRGALPQRDVFQERNDGQQDHGDPQRRFPDR